MSPEEYERLRLAERFCLIYGWSALAHNPTDRQKAAHTAWQEWFDHVGMDFARKDRHPDLTDEVLIDLAERYIP